MIKATLLIGADGKRILKDIPCELPPGEYEVDCNVLFSVGVKEPKEVSILNKNLYAEAKKILLNNIESSHIGWYSLGVLIDHLEKKYDITEKVKS